MRENKGFTLIEIMIVIVIIAVMSAIVSLNVGSPNYSRFMTGVEKLANTFAILADESVFTNSVISCEVEPKSLSCRKYRDGEWKDLPLSKLMAWGWPQGFKINKIMINGIALRDKQLIKFIPSGDNGGISLEVTDGNFSAWIDSDLSGHFKVSN
ncbi:MAG: type secretion system protein GspH [Pseudomonadota bacterium]|jgi:general secretion pathway protein H